MSFTRCTFYGRMVLTGISVFGSGSLSSNLGRLRSGGTGRTVLLTGLCFFGLLSFLFDFLGFLSDGKGLLIIRLGFLMTRFRTAACVSVAMGTKSGISSGDETFLICFF